MTDDRTPFDIHQKLFDEGELLEKQAVAYQEQLFELFAASPEAQVSGDDTEPLDSFWPDTVVEFGLRYLGLTLPEIGPEDLAELLYDLFPAKVSAIEFDAEEAFRALRAFWQYLKREYALENADACLKALSERAQQRFDRAMNDPRNYGIAKSMFMMGAARGFDMHSEEGIKTWMETYNQELASGTGTPIPFPGERGPQADIAHSQMRSANRKAKIKRKQAKASRKQNRKKKK